MPTLPLIDITVPARRQRQHFDEDKLMELADSICAVGMLSPIVVRETPEGAVELVCGERRMRAVELIHLRGSKFQHEGGEVEDGFIPYVQLGDLSPELRFQAELEENTMREDLTWQERAAAIARLHELRKELAGAPEPEADAIRKTAEVVLPTLSPGGARNAVAESLVVSRYLDDPDVRKASSRPEAMKIIKRKVEREQNARLAASHTASAESKFTLHQGDCLTVMERMVETQERFDVILTDPPYGMGADVFGDAGGKMTAITHEYTDDKASVLELLRRVFPLVSNLAKPEAHLYMYCDIDMFAELRALALSNGWTPHRTPLVHLKREGGRVPWPTNGPRRAYELVLYAMRGRRPTTAIYPDVFDTSLTEKTWGHGAQKPVEGYVNLLQRSCRPGDRVLDCFAGTGTIFEAAHRLRLYATGIEMDAANIGICKQRMEELK